MLKSNKKEGLSRGQKNKENLGCVLIGPSIAIVFCAALIQIKCGSGEKQVEKFSKRQQPPTPFQIPEKTPESEVIHLSQEQINRILSQINSKINPHNYNVIGYNLPKPDAQISGALQILPIKLDEHRQILTESQKLYIDPVAGVATSPVTPLMLIGIEGPDNQVNLWFVIKAEIILIGNNQRLTPREIEVIAGRIRSFSSANMGFEDLLFIKADNN